MKNKTAIIGMLCIALLAAMVEPVPAGEIQPNLPAIVIGVSNVQSGPSVVGYFEW